MTSPLIDLLFRIFLLESLAFFLLGTVLLSRRFFGQPIDRIRLTQFGFGVLVLAILGIGLDFGPKWSILNGPHEQVLLTPEFILQESNLEISAEEVRSETLLPSTFSPLSLHSDDPAVVPNAETAYLSAPTRFPVETRAPTDENIDKAALPIVLEPAKQSPPETGIAAGIAVESLVMGHSLFSWNLFVVIGLLIFLLPPLAFFLREIRAWFCLSRIQRRSLPVPQSVDQLFSQIRKKSRYRIDLRYSDEITAPVVFGLFRTILLLPEKIICGSDVSSHQLRACLAHEWSHLKNHDLTTWNIVRFFQYLLWIQPFYWMLRTRLLADQDYLADDEAARECSEAVEYAQILLELARKPQSSVPNNALGMAGHKSQLRRRIEMLFNESRPARTSNKRKLLLPFLLLTMLALLGGAIRFSETTAAQQIAGEKTAEQASQTEMQPLTITSNEEGERVISGILYDKVGNPAVEAAVLLYEEKSSGPTEIVKETEPVRTDHDGKFMLKAKQMFAILCRSDDGCDFFYYEIPQERDQKLLPVARLVPGEAITGQVVDSKGHTIADATVGYYTLHRLNHQVKSDSEGHFTIYHPKDGPKVLALFAFKSKAGFDYRLFGSEFEGSEYENGQPENIDLSQPFQLTLAGAEPVRLKVVWDDGRPATGVTIAPWTLQNPNQPSPLLASPIFSDSSFNFAMLQYSTRQQVDENGVVEFDWMPSWLERVDFFYADFPWWAENVPWLRVNLDFRNDSHDKTVVLFKQRKATGTVRFADGQPAEGITVKGEGVKLNYEYKQASAKTDAAGHYEIDVIPETAYILAVDDPEWGAPAYNPLVINERTRAEEIQNLDFTLKKKVKIHGNVTFGSETQLHQGYKVNFSLRGQSDESLPKEKQLTRARDDAGPCNDNLHYYLWHETVINDDGTYAIQLGPGAYHVSIHENYVGIQGLVRNLLPENTMLTVPEDATEEILFEITADGSKNGRLHGKVLLADGSPAQNAKLIGAYYDLERTNQMSSTPDFSATTDAEGNFDAPRTRQIMQLFISTDDGKQQAVFPLDADVESLENTPFTLRATGSVHGRAIDLRGDPMPDVELIYGVMVYGISDKNNWHDTRRDLPQRIRAPLRFGGTVKTDAAGRFQVDHLPVDADCRIAYRAAKNVQLGGKDTFQLVQFRLEQSGENLALGDGRINPIALEGWKMSESSATENELQEFTALFLDHETAKPMTDIRVELFWLRITPDMEEKAIAEGRSLDLYFQPSFYGNDLRTDADGKIRFTRPEQAAVYDPSELRLGIACFRSFPVGEDWNSVAYMPLSKIFSEPFEQTMTFRVIPYSHVNGKILDTEGNPVQGAHLKVFTLRRENISEEDSAVSFFVKHFKTISNENGNVRIMVAPGFDEGNMVCNAPGFVPWSIDFKDRKMDSEDDWTFTLEKGIDVSGRVVDTAGNGIAEVWVNFLSRATDLQALGIIHNEWFGRSVKTDAEGHFIAPSLDKQEYTVQLTARPCCPNAENIKPAEYQHEAFLSEQHVFANSVLDLRSGENGETVTPEPHPLTIIGHPTIPVKFSWTDETKEKNLLNYSLLSFHGRFPDLDEIWSVPTQRVFDPENQNTQIGTVYLPKGMPVTLSALLREMVVINGVGNPSNAPPENVTLEYRFAQDADWQPCTELEPTDPTYIMVNASLGVLEEDGPRLEIRVR